MGNIFDDFTGKSKEKEKRKYYQKVARKLKKQYNKLSKRYRELSVKSKKEIKSLVGELAAGEVYKDSQRLAIRLQNNLILLMQELDTRLSLEKLSDFREIVLTVNNILVALNEELLIIDDYIAFKLNQAVEYMIELDCEMTEEQIKLVKKISIPIAMELANNKNYFIREAVAKNQETPDYILKNLAEDKEVCVRAAVAGNPSTSSSLLKKLANDQRSIVRASLITHSKTSTSILKKLLGDKREYVQKAAKSELSKRKKQSLGAKKTG